MTIQSADWPDGWVVYCPDNLPFIRVWGKEANTYSPQYEDCPEPVFYDSGKPGPVVFRSRKMAEQHAKKIAQGFPKWNKSAEVIHTKDLVNLMPSPPELVPQHLTDPPVTLEWQHISIEPIFYVSSFDRYAHNVMKSLEEQYNKRLSATLQENLYNTEPVGKPDA